MKVRLNVLIIFMLCVVMISAVGVVRRLKDDRGLWTPNDIYTQVGGSTSSSVSSSSLSSSESGVPVRSYSTAPRRRVSSYAPAASVRNNSLIASSPLASSTTGALYTTSSAKVRSFGGGGNAGGVSMSGGQVKSTGSSMAASAGMNVFMPSTSVLARNTKSANAVLPSVSGDIAMASSYQGVCSTARGLGGRKNAPGRDPYDVWLEWLRQHGGTYVDPDGEGVYNWDYESAWDAFCGWFNMAYPGSSPEDYTGADAAILWEQWLSWFMSNNGTHTDSGNNIHNFLPIGDYIPLLIMALLYVGYIAIRRRNKTENVKP